MSVTYGFYNSMNHDRKYSSIDISSIFDGVINDGVYETIGDHFSVTQHADGANMSVDVGSGRAWFNHTWTLNDSTLTLDIPSSDLVLNRIDAVVLEVNASINVRQNAIKILKGTPAENPVNPTLTNSADIHQYALAYVYVGSAVSSIINDNITNVIGDGLETPFATGAVQNAPLMIGASSDNDGNKGLVPKPVAGDESKFLRGDGTFYGYVTAGQKAGETLGTQATAEGDSTTASGKYSHAEGENTTASDAAAHAEGSGTTASGYASHAEGSNTTASGVYAHAEGRSTTASGDYSHAEGKNTTASGIYAHAGGSNTTASGSYAHAEGGGTKALGIYAHAGGSNTTANYAQTTIGMLNVTKGSDSSYTANSGYFIVGCGSPTRANCFRVTESNTYGKTYATSGADYAEMFEWLDGNKNNEDRAGKFVTLSGRFIKLAKPTDDYILGVVSGNPSVCGDIYDDQWSGMFETDIFGRPVYTKEKAEDIVEERPIINPETGEVTGSKKVVIAEGGYNDVLKVSDKYDNSVKYIPRSERPEWDPVGLIGKLVCIDDGTSMVNGYVTINDDSIATFSNVRTSYRVMERIDDSHIRIMIL